MMPLHSVTCSETDRIGEVLRSGPAQHARGVSILLKLPSLSLLLIAVGIGEIFDILI